MSFTDFFKAPKEGSLEHKVKSFFADVKPLETPRLHLVKISPEHAEDMFEYSKDSDVTKYLTWSCHSSLKETERYIKLLQKKYQSGVFNDFGIVVKDTGKFIGTCGFTNIDYNENSAEMGYVIAKSHWGMGYATEALTAVMKFGMEHFGLCAFCAKCMQGNDASLHVMQKCGMTLEGIYHNSMFIKGEYKTIIVCRGTKEQVFSKICEKELTE